MYIAPIDRSTSPRMSTKTSPAPRIASGAKYGSRVLKFEPVKNELVFAEK
jgi:hypothetical protein